MGKRNPHQVCLSREGGDLISRYDRRNLQYSDCLSIDRSWGKWKFTFLKNIKNKFFPEPQNIIFEKLEIFKDLKKKICIFVIWGNMTKMAIDFEYSKRYISVKSKFQK